MTARSAHLAIAPLALLALAAPTPARGAGGFAVHSFERQELTGEYYSEGIGYGDLDQDGHTDIVHGPFWFAGPGFDGPPRPIYKALPQPREAYADSFFSWVYDFDRDGWPDIFAVGFPGTPAHVYRNPGAGGWDAPWQKHEVFDWVSNESPQFTDLVGDSAPELVCTRDGLFGYATIDPDRPFEPWTFHRISPRPAPARFGHGLGVGDVNGDRRHDVLMKSGWFEQPATTAGEPVWKFHDFPFAPTGGADMHAYDVDGDGDSDIITSLAAHAYGLSWFEQRPATNPDGSPHFVEHLILGDRPAHNRYGVAFSELHSVALADIDGDGLEDIVTGKTYWSHHRQAPGWDDGAVVYWFKLTRGEDGVGWIPFRADTESGIGRQVVAADVNGDGLPDILAGGMKGANLLVHQRTEADQATWRRAQPTAVQDRVEIPTTGPPAPIDPESGAVAGATEGESDGLKAVATSGETRPQPMENFSGGKWSGDAQLFWTGGGVGDSLAFDIEVPSAGPYAIETVFTRAPDYAIVQLHLDDNALGDPVDLYDFSKVTTTGVLSFDAGQLEPGRHRVKIEITGANPHAAPSKFVGLDYIRLATPEAAP